MHTNYLTWLNSSKKWNKYMNMMIVLLMISLIQWKKLLKVMIKIEMVY